jgi:site-specific DNA-methyltransferase (adenine-specific)
MLNMFDGTDLIIVDPSYESLERHRSIGTTTRLQNKWFPTVPNDYFINFFSLAYNVLRDNTHLYMFCDQETMFIVVPMAINAGFKFWKPLVWHKKRIGMGYHYRACYEFILFFEKGKRKLNNLSIPDILEEPRITGKYPTQKPVKILETLILQSSLPNETVLDPFMGSGSTGVAAIKNNRKFIGCDILKECVELTRYRINTEANVNSQIK